MFPGAGVISDSDKDREGSTDVDDIGDEAWMRGRSIPVVGDESFGMMLRETDLSDDDAENALRRLATEAASRY